MNVKNIPKKVAKVVVRETLETLKKAQEQVTGRGEYAPEKGENKEPQKEEKPQTQKPDEKKLEIQRRRQLEALERETQEIIEIKKAQKAQQEHHEEMIKQEEENKPKEPPPQISSVPKRGLAIFRKGLGKNIEQRKPPSG